MLLYFFIFIISYWRFVRNNQSHVSYYLLKNYLKLNIYFSDYKYIQDLKSQELLSLANKT